MSVDLSAIVLPLSSTDDIFILKKKEDYIQI